MKTRILLTLTLLLSLSVFAQDNNYSFDWDGNKVGWYVGTAGKISSLNAETAGYLDLKGALIFNDKWAIGVDVTGLYYDKALTQLVDDGTYHLYVGYTGLFIERIFSFNEDFKLSLSILSGYGEAYYQYDNEFRKDKKWNEEFIDRTEFFVIEPGIEIQHRISENFWLGLTGSVRTGSPLQLYGTSDNLLHKLSGGISFKYGIF